MLYLANLSWFFLKAPLLRSPLVPAFTIEVAALLRYVELLMPLPSSVGQRFPKCAVPLFCDLRQLVSKFLLFRVLRFPFRSFLSLILVIQLAMLPLWQLFPLLRVPN